VILGVVRTLIVLCGVAAAVLTVVARRSGDWELVRVGAVASLLMVLVIVVFVVPPLVRGARAEAAQLDLPVQFTTGGVIFIGIFVVVSLAAWNTGNNLLFLVFSVLFSTLFVAWTAARVSLLDLSVSARFPDHIFAGEAAPVIVTVHNTKRVLPSFSVVVEARSRAEGGRRGRGLARFQRERFERRVLAYFMYVPHGARVEQRVEQSFERRGHVLVTGFEISTRFPFGFFRIRRRLRARDVDLVIYPKPRSVGDDLHLLPIDAGQMQGARRGAGHDLHSLRDYQPQDDMRHIDWKATARLRQLVVREFTEEEERRVHVVFDTRMKTGEEDVGVRFEQGVGHAASLVSHFTDERAELALTLGDEQGRYGAGREHLYDCLRRLALVQPAAATSDERARLEFWQRIAPPPSASGDGYVILITAAAPGTIPANVWRKSHVIYI
jgi:uncharacterized protein (DUF58 family)